MLPFASCIHFNLMAPELTPAQPVMLHLAHITALLAHITALLAHITVLLAHITVLLAHITALLAHITVLLAHITVLLAHITALLAHKQPNGTWLRHSTSASCLDWAPNITELPWVPRLRVCGQPHAG